MGHEMNEQNIMATYAVHGLVANLISAFQNNKFKKKVLAINELVIHSIISHTF